MICRKAVTANAIKIRSLQFSIKNVMFIVAKIRYRDEALLKNYICISNNQLMYGGFEI